ncbi:MAG: alanine racemase [Gemmatimonadaceae bacterium]
MDGNQIYQAPSRAWLDLDLAALRRNADALARRAGVPLIPMVKADGYGVGAGPVVATLEPTDPWGYGVATVREGSGLRRLGVRRPIIVFTPMLASDFKEASAADLTPTLCSAEAIQEWSKTGGPYHLAIDTGMNRSGVCWRDVSAIAAAVQAYPPAGAYTHFHSAELDDGSSAVQEERFRTALRMLGTKVPFVHTANSASIVRGGAEGWDAVRPGVFLYGVGSGSTVGMRPDPVVHLRARVVELRELGAGDTVSYGATYVARGAETIATVAAGYGDGYPRALSNRGSALLNGAPVPVRGLVTMDMTMFDVSHTQCQVGDIVTLIGSDSGNTLTVEDVAHAAQMSPYELLTGLSPRLDRCHHDDIGAAV